MLAKRKADDERDQLMTAAWLTAALSRTEKFPKLSEFLKRPRVQSPEEQHQMWHYIADTFGGKVRKHNPKRVRIVRVH